VPDPKTLAQAIASFGSYPEDHPSTLRGLLDAEPDTITHPLAWFLRAQAVEVKRSAEQHYVNSPKDAFKLLRNGYVLHPWTGKWTSYALSGSRQVITVPHPRGGVTPLLVHTPILPKHDDLLALPPGARNAAKQPAWLVIFGGTPDVLSKPGVAKGLNTLRRRAPVADVLFFDRDTDAGTPPTLWSLVAGVGMSDTGSTGGREVPFPDIDALNEARRT
jgi:hypothetical protein